MYHIVKQAILLFSYCRNIWPNFIVTDRASLVSVTKQSMFISYVENKVIYTYHTVHIY